MPTPIGQQSNFAGPASSVIQEINIPGLFTGGTASTITATFTTPGFNTWQAPLGLPTANVQCWGGGSGANGGRLSGVAGGGGGEYAAEPNYVLISGFSYTIYVGAGGVSSGTGISSFLMGGVTPVTANGGGSNINLGLGGTGSNNTVHFNGGNGGAGGGAGGGGGGGGGSGGQFQSGNPGIAGSSSGAGGAGAVAVTGGGPGGAGGSGTVGSSPLTTPGGGGGGAGANAFSNLDVGGKGANGQVIISYPFAPPPITNLSGLATFSSLGSPRFNSNVTDVVDVTQNAYLAANVEIGGNLIVDGLFNQQPTTTSFTVNGPLNVNPGPLTVTGSAASFGGLVAITQSGSGASKPGTSLFGQNTGDPQFGVALTSDNFPRFQITAGGTVSWGAGANLAPDVSLYRSGASGLAVAAGSSAQSVFSIINTSVTPAFATSSITAAAAGDSAFAIQVSGDTVPRFASDSTGLFTWGGGGTAVADIQLSRPSANRIQIASPTSSVAQLNLSGSNPTTNVLLVTNQASGPSTPVVQILAAGSTDFVLGIKQTTNSNNNFRIDSQGKINWGSGSAGLDTDLYRTGVNALTTDGSLTANGVVLPNQAYLNNLIAPNTAASETLPRSMANVAQTQLSTGVLYLRAIPLPANFVVTNLTFTTASTAANGVTQGYYLITDSSRIVRGVTANQTGGTTWTNIQTGYTLPLTSGYTTPSAGLYYLGISVTGGTTPNLSGANIVNGANSTPPILGGTTGTVNAPPSVGSTLGTLTANSNFNHWAWTS